MKQGKSKTIFKAVGIFLALVLVVSLGAVIFKITNGFIKCNFFKEKLTIGRKVV